MPLTAAQIGSFRSRLEHRRDELLAALRAGTENPTDKNLTEQSAPVRDAGDESVALTTADASMSELQSDTQEIRAIDAALDAWTKASTASAWTAAAISRLPD
jgi:RNA polymerase-binding transcription factor DksA